MRGHSHSIIEIKLNLLKKGKRKKNSRFLQIQYRNLQEITYFNKCRKMKNSFIKINKNEYYLINKNKNKKDLKAKHLSINQFRILKNYNHNFNMSYKKKEKIKKPLK
jgi:hypothetical protein